MTKYAALTEGPHSDFMYNSDPVCPHCGTEIKVLEHHWINLYEPGIHQKVCPYCHEQFKITSYSIYRFDTDEQEE